MRTRPLTALCSIVLAGSSLAAAAAADRDEILAALLPRAERTFQTVERLRPTLSSRGLFEVGLVFCEAGQHMDRLERLFEVATRMQDRDENSRGFGNFRWRWQDGAVLDYNAVEFCMQHGALIKLRHGDKLPPKAAALLDELIRYSVQGCLRHRVPESYTNIALMNAQNLVLLGEILGDDAVLAEGRRRLDVICEYTSECGIHEYCSPTYTGVDLDCLLSLHAFTRTPSVKKQTEVLLELFWTGLAANWYAPAGKLGGTRSRDYNYLHGLGMLDYHLWREGWLPADTPGMHGRLVDLFAAWHPPARLLEMNRKTYPRAVEQTYGMGRMQFRWHYVQPDVSLGCSGANYGPMDLPLCVDFASGDKEDRKAVRTYFIPDARRDPYGKKRIPAGGGHEKTLHLRPFWAGVQRGPDALGLVVYRERDYPPNPASLESHIVLPAAIDGVTIAGKAIALDPQTPAVHPVPAGDALVIRKGAAVAGIRLAWTRAMDGSPAPAALVVDGNSYGALRLSVGHHSFWGVNAKGSPPGAAFWVRVGSGLRTEQDVERWTAAFRSAALDASESDGEVRVRAAGLDGAVELAAGPPFRGCLKAEPAPTRTILAVNREDLGSQIMARLPGVQRRQDKVKAYKPLVVGPDGRAAWEAEAGLTFSGMTVGKDDDAFGSQFVWVPGQPGEKGGIRSARAIWRLQLPRADTYYLWGRVKAPTPDDDSFFVSVSNEQTDLIARTDWHTGTHLAWEWTPVSLDRTATGTPLRLPQGPVTLELRCREDGTAIDRLYITTDPNDQPQ